MIPLMVSQFIRGLGSRNVRIRLPAGLILKEAANLATNWRKGLKYEGRAVSALREESPSLPAGLDPRGGSTSAESVMASLHKAEGCAGLCKVKGHRRRRERARLLGGKPKGMLPLRRRGTFKDCPKPKPAEPGSTPADNGTGQKKQGAGSARPGTRPQVPPSLVQQGIQLHPSTWCNALEQAGRALSYTTATKKAATAKPVQKVAAVELVEEEASVSQEEADFEALLEQGALVEIDESSLVTVEEN